MMEKNESLEAEQEMESRQASDEDGLDKKSGLSLRLWMILGGSLLICLLAAAAGFYLMKSKKAAPPSPKTALVNSITSLTRPIPSPDKREVLDFLIAYQVEGRETVTALRMEARFQNLERYARFKKNTVVFRQTVYNFLLGQNAAYNTVKSWDSVFAKNLLDYLRANLPGSCPDKIRLTQVENL